MDAASLIATEYRRRKAMIENDLDTLDRIMADHFHYAHINGLVEDREAYLERMRSGAVQCPYTSARELKVTVREGYALLTGESTIGYQWLDGPSGEVNTLFTSIWEPSADGWKLVAYASTPLSEADLMPS